MATTGIVKWYSPEKGYGFITPDEGGRDVFVHASSVSRAKLESIGPGDRLSYDLKTNERTGKLAAADLIMVERGSSPMLKTGSVGR